MTNIITAMVGNFVDDPELRFSNAGKPFTRGRISVRPYVKGAAEQPPTEYYDVVCFGTLAENVAESCRKGTRVIVAGKLEEETWTGRDGVERTSTKLIADAIGPDLRFNTATINQASRRAPEPAPEPAPDTTVTGLVGRHRPATTRRFDGCRHGPQPAQRRSAGTSLWV